MLSISHPGRLRGTPLAAALGAFLLTASLASGARAQVAPLPRAWSETLRPLDSLARTGVIYDRVLPLAHLEQLDGSAVAPAVDPARWRQAYDELRRASSAPFGPTLEALDAGARASMRSGVIPLAMFDRRFERVRPSALDDGSLRVTAGRLEVAGSSPLVEERAVSAAALLSHTYRGKDVVFALERQRFFSDDVQDPRQIVMDFGDGEGPRTVRFGEGVEVHYSSVGRRTLLARLTRADGSRAEARFTFDVLALSTPSPDDTLHVTATIPYHGEFGTGDAYVYLADNHAALTNPVVVIEGFDLDNSMNWDELYALLNKENLLETLRADGYDAVVLNFTDATDAIEKNGLLVAELIQEVQAQIDPSTSLALVGASMGGLCSRYALSYLESHGIPHRVRTWISFDSPQAGADIPLGLQHWINFFSGQSADAASFLATLQRPAAREMLLYHYSATAGNTAHEDPERDSLAVSLAAVGDYPQLTRRVAIANGSGTAASQGFVAGDQVIRYEYSSFLVSITGDVWAVPDKASQQIFNGSTRILFSTTTQNVTVSGTQPWDGAPGGSRASFTELDTSTAPYGDIVALHPSHCFIPTISSLARSTTDPFFDVANASDPLSLTPFDAIYFPTDNQEHVLITPENAVWVRDEVEQGVVAVPEGSGGGRSPTLTGAPNPFRDSSHLSWVMPKAGATDLCVYAVDGSIVRTLVHGMLPAGPHAIAWDGRDSRGGQVAAGVYFARLQTSNSRLTIRIVKLKE
jgi:pimeloyl-ACP methyl ester carboxylesterase